MTCYLNVVQVRSPIFLLSHSLELHCHLWSTLVFSFDAIPGRSDGVWFYADWIRGWLIRRKWDHIAMQKLQYWATSLNTKGAFTRKLTAIRCFYINNISPIQVCAFYLYSFKSWNCLDKREGLYIIHTHTDTHTHTHISKSSLNF